MTRVLSASACKLKCDEQLPVCKRCLRVNLYCDRAPELKFRVHRRPSGDGHNLKADEPTNALRNIDVARLFNHYNTNLAPWYDLSDGRRHFGRDVPRVALWNTFLFNAALAFAAIHLSRTSVSSARLTAETYHSRCIQHLIKSDHDQLQTEDGSTLAADCLLRSYELLAEDEGDPNRHLSGAYAIAAGQTTELGTPSLLCAGFFNYLREDITYSLMYRQPLKLDLAQVVTDHYLAQTDEDQLNVATLFLAEIINAVFGDHNCNERLSTLREKLDI